MLDRVVPVLDALRFAEREIRILGDVAGGEDIRGRGAAELVHRHTVPHVEAGGLGEVGLGLDADAGEHDLRGGLPAARGAGDQVALVGFERDHLVVRDGLDALLPVVLATNSPSQRGSTRDSGHSSR